MPKDEQLRLLFSISIDMNKKRKKKSPSQKKREERRRKEWIKQKEDVKKQLNNYII